jgi:4-diphosphocytidyl-2-C-methyl-D-erythritol kinase
VFPKPLDIETRAHAKINLHLEVLNRRPDGYHNIFSLMARVGLHDLLKLGCDLNRRAERGLELFLRAEGGAFSHVIEETPLEKNLISLAIRAYCARSGLSGAVHIAIEKNIPAGAGLGGGSSDAAAVLNALNERYDLLSREDLIGIGRSLGADIPFCMTGDAAFCEGVGDRIKKVSCSFRHHVLIAYNGTHVATAGAYQTLNRTKETRKSREELGRMRSEIASICMNGDISALSTRTWNDFERPVFERHESLARIKTAMIEGGADHAAMTGSGSAVFGLFQNEEPMEYVRAALEIMGIWSCKTEFM